MNPVRRSALAIAATCGAVALAPVVDAAPLSVPTDGATTDAVPAGSVPATPAPVVEECAPTTSAPATTTPTTTPTSTPTSSPTATPAVTTTTVATATVVGATATDAAAGSTDTTTPPTSTPTDPCTTTTTSTVPTTTIPDTENPSSTSTPSTAVPTSSVGTTVTSTVAPASTETPSATTSTEVPATETATTEAGATASATAEPQGSSGTPGGVEPIGPSTPTSTNPPLPPLNPSWTTEGVPRFVVPRIPGSTSLQPGRTPAGERVVLAENVDVILATIRQLESHDRYDIGPNRALASGAYQYIPSTWNNYGGYPEAYLAPPEVQDERARADVERILSMYGGNLSMVPVMWYYPRAAIEPLWMDRVPNPGGGNRLTIREYQTLWLERLDENASTMLGTYVTTPASPAALSVLSETPTQTTTIPVDPFAADLATVPETTVPPTTVPPTTVPPTTVPPTTVPPTTVPLIGPPVPEPTLIGPPVPTTTVPAPRIVADEVTVSEATMELAARSVPPEYEPTDGAGWTRTIVFPVLGPVAYADGWMDSRDGGRRRHEGTDIVGVQMQPILAAVDGEVTRLQTESIGIRGVAITIRDSEGWRYNYFHDNNDTPGTDDGQASDAFRLAPGLEVGSLVVAGQIIGYMGDSGNAEDSVTHLHFEFRDPGGSARPSYWSLRSAEARQACTIGIGPWSTPVLSAQVELESLPDEPDTLVADTLVADGRAFASPTTEAPDLADVPDATIEPLIEHTVVTPMYGDGQWVIDSDGRVTATGDAALILPRRDLQCDPGPATPFGTDAAGWRVITTDIVDGTVLEGADLSETILADVVRDPEPPPTDPAVPTDAEPSTTGPAVPTEVVPVPDTPPISVPIPTWTSAGFWPTGSNLADGADPDPAEEAPSTLPIVDIPVEPLAEPLAFVDTATGETIIVRFERPLRPDRLIGPR